MSPTRRSTAVGPAGNAAGTGALIALLSGDARREIERVVRTVEKIETAVEPRFQEHFVDAMALPHRTAADAEPRSGGASCRRGGAIRPMVAAPGRPAPRVGPSTGDE